ncbi:MAG: hypothetical protein ACKOAR_14710, partial [Bacteroidota bacterium]
YITNLTITTTITITIYCTIINYQASTICIDHQLVIVHNRNDQLSTLLTEALEKFNAGKYAAKKLVTSNLALNETYTLTFVLEFTELPEAREYLDRVLQQILDTGNFVNFKFDIFVITKENFGTFYRTKALDEYLAFYDRNY